MSVPAEQRDVIVIGSGQGGVPLAVALAHEGRRVVLFERGTLGGTCVNVGCTPSKTFLASAHAAGRARRAARIGVKASLEIDQRAVFQRVRRLRGEWVDGVAEKFVDAKVELVRAEASFVAERTVQAGGRTFAAPLVILDTGGRPVVPPIPGLAGTPFLTNTTFFDQIELPKRLIVLGGGYIGLELGQGAQRLGAQVTVVNHGTRIMEREEHDASAVLAQMLDEDGVAIRSNAVVAQVAYDGKAFAMKLASGEQLEAEGLLVATGRMPNTAALAPHLGNVECKKGGYIEVDDYLKTTCDGVYALGDVAGQPQFTHVSWEDHRRILSTLAGKPRKRDDRVLAYTTFTEPQLARVGYTEHDAREKGIDARSVTLPLSNVARAIEWDVEAGFFRLVIDKANDKIIGATFVGYECGELIHVILAHIEAGSTWQLLDNSVHVHPTLAEGLPTLARLLA